MNVEAFNLEGDVRMLKKKTIGLLAGTLLIAACNGGGGGGGGSSETYTEYGGNFYAEPSTAIGSVCMNYTMTSTNCSAIGGSWNSSAVPAVFSCQNATPGATNGYCQIDNLKFTASVSPVSVEAKTKCEELGGLIVPNNQTDCDAVSGNWTQTSAASTAYACSKAPSDLAECEAVGGRYGHYRLLPGHISPPLEGVDAGKAFLFPVLDSSDEARISSGTEIASLSGVVRIHDMDSSDVLWTAPAPISKASNFRNQPNSASSQGYDLAFDVNFGREYGLEEYDNGVRISLQFYYKD